MATKYPSPAAKVLLLGLAGFSFTFIGCGGGATSIDINPQAPTISISSKPASVPVNGTLTFTATTTGGSASTPTWTLVPLGPMYSNLGSLSSSSGKSITYTAPSSPPLYTSDPASQGKVYLQAETSSPFGTALDSATFVITAPSITASISPTVATVSLGNFQQFYGAAVGNTDNGVIFQVNGVTGGSTATGTITATGSYTAPSTMPMTGNVVTITVISHADPTKSATATVTLL